MKKVFENLKANINKKDFIRYTFFIVLLLVTVVTIATQKITYSKYESSAALDVKPTVAFFLVNVGTTTNSIRLTDMVPSSTPYTYTFQVSNFNDTEKANVDLTYSIELITTTNLPLDFQVYKGTATGASIVDSDTTTQDVNGMYYRHLVINGVSEFDYAVRKTDTYILWVNFPLTYKNNPNLYEGVIELVDIKITATQIV